MKIMEKIRQETISPIPATHTFLMALFLCFIKHFINDSNSSSDIKSGNINTATKKPPNEEHKTSNTIDDKIIDMI